MTGMVGGTRKLVGGPRARKLLLQLCVLDVGLLQDGDCQDGPFRKSAGTDTKLRSELPEGSLPTSSPNLKPVFLRHRWNDTVQAQVCEVTEVSRMRAFRAGGSDGVEF